MADHELIEPAPKLVTEGISPKAVAATVVSVLVGIAVAVLNAVQENPSLLGPLPVWAQGVILALVPAVITALSAFLSSPGTVTLKSGS
jgi:hypothetical protein